MQKFKKFFNNKYGLVIVTVLSLFFIFASLLQFSHSVSIRKDKMNIDTVQEIATQSVAFVDEEINSHINFLISLSHIVDVDNMQDPYLFKTLEEIVETSDFQKIGIADLNGQATITDGSTLNISQRDYFKASLKGESFISDTLDSQISHEKVVICSVPIYANDKTIMGVFCGVLELEKIHIFKSNALESENRYIHIIDGNGNYIYCSNHGNRISDESDNFFDGIKDLQKSETIETIKKTMKKGENLVVHVSKDNDKRIVYFTKLKNCDWSVVSVVDRHFMSENVELLLYQDVFLLAVNISGALIVLGIVIIHYLRKEKRYISWLNQNLKHNEQIYRAVAVGNDNIVFVYDPEKDILRFVSGYIEKFPLDMDIPNGTNAILEIFKDCLNGQEILDRMIESIKEKKPTFDSEIAMKKDGKSLYYEIHAYSLYDENGDVGTFVGHVKEITEIKEKENSLRFQAEIDALTGVYNRKGGIQRIKKSLLKEGHHALVLLDLDNFKMLNDTFGHQKGDQALKDVCNILRKHFHVEDIICRLGGDEFVVFVENISEEVVLKIIKALSKKLQILYYQDNREVQLTASMGIVLVPCHGKEFDELYEKADIALYKAKSRGRNCFYLYEGETIDEEK